MKIAVLHSPKAADRVVRPVATAKSLSIVTLSALFLATGAGHPVQQAGAQGFFDDYSAPYYRPNKPKKVKRAPSVTSDEAPKSSKSKNKDDNIIERAGKGPLVINVSINRQRLTVYDENGPVTSSPVSTGRIGHATPTGVFSIVQKKRMHHSNIYDSAPMPNMQRITWSGVALHAGALPGYPASHGCIRLPHGFSKKLYGITQMGTRVIVSRDPVTPVPIAHDRLFKAFPPEETVASVEPHQEETQVADASGILGVSPAAAATTLDLATLSYRERRRLENEKLNAEIRDAGYAKTEKQLILAAAQKDAATVRAPLVAARAEAKNLEAQLAELESSLSKAESELADLKSPAEETSKSKRKQKAKDESKRIARIATLEERVVRLPDEIAAIRPALTHAQEALTSAEAAADVAEEKLRLATNGMSDATAALSRALAKEETAKKLEKLRERPVSIFISRAKQRLYVRQGYDDVFDVAVTFNRPDDPIGTHVFTALDVAENKTDMKWSVVSIPHDPTRTSKKKKGTKKDDDQTAAKIDLSSQTAAAALDRIAVPDDVRDQIADVMKPNSSIIISDLGISNETGAYTDFIASLR
jgi:lipoprotein-anchoring transpeptidase ErfK/SrfK/predicted  nucleic acid-binding Zn-ribbon protein